MSCSIAIAPAQETQYYSIKSIYIPRIFENITSEKIKHTFEVLDLGIISHIDLVPRGPPNSKMAFIHFREWFTNPSAQNLAKKILDPETQAKLVYDDPWYWILLPNNKPIGLPREETIEGLKQIIYEYKLIIDDLESQLFETWKQDKKHETDTSIALEASSISPVCSTSSWEMSDFDDKNDKGEKYDNDDVKSLMTTSSGVLRPKITIPKQSGFIAKISNWHSQNDREFLGCVNFEHLSEEKKPKDKDEVHDIEMGITQTYAKIVPIDGTNPLDTMFDSKGNKYIRQSGKWFKIEERRIAQHFWCDP